MKLTKTGAKDIRRLALVATDIAKLSEAGHDRGYLSQRLSDLSDVLLDAIGDYKAATAFMAFVTGPLQQRFIERYEDDITADAERRILEMYDDPRTRRRAAIMAAQQGRIIVLEDGHWAFQTVESFLDLLRFLGDSGAAPSQLMASLPLGHLQGAEEPIVYRSTNRPNQGPDEAEAPPEEGGMYL